LTTARSELVVESDASKDCRLVAGYTASEEVRQLLHVLELHEREGVLGANRSAANCTSHSTASANESTRTIVGSRLMRGLSQPMTSYTTAGN